MEVLLGIIRESWLLLTRMSPYLLFGFAAAGLLHAFMDTRRITAHLGERSLVSVVKASLIGIPLPLCSCGVLPLAASLRREGASKGAILSFLISTPTTGVDSIFATYSLLGWFFTAYRVLASFAAGVLSGLLANVLLKDDDAVKAGVPRCKMCEMAEEHGHSFVYKAKSAFKYAFVELMTDTGKWLLAGVIIGGTIAYFVPESFVRTFMGSGLRAMLIMLVIGIPMYVCASGSIPIAAALMLKGLNPGAAFVFLFAGPATNAAGMAVIGGQLGRKALAIYLFSIVVCSLAMGALLDFLWNAAGMTFSLTHMHGGEGAAAWPGVVCGTVLLGLIVNAYLRARVRSEK